MPTKIIKKVISRCGAKLVVPTKQEIWRLSGYKEKKL